MTVSVLLFKNKTCVPCAQFEPVFNDVVKTYEGRMDVQKVDISVDAKLAIEYGVLGVPTVLILKDNAEVDRLIGAVTKKQLESSLESAVK
jgi:thioredoxin 1